MALKEQVIPLPMEQGVDAGVDPLSSTLFLKAENAIFERRNEVRKRNGNEVFGSALTAFDGTTTRTPQRLAVRDDTAVAYGRGNLWELTDEEQLELPRYEGLSIDRVLAQNHLVSADIDTFSAISTDGAICQMDVVESGNYIGLVTTTFDGTYYVISLYSFNRTTRSLVKQTDVDTSSNTKRVMARFIDNGGDTVKLLRSYDNGDVKIYDVALATLTLSNSVTSSGLIHNSGSDDRRFFDACEALNRNCVIARTSATQFKVQQFDQSDNSSAAAYNLTALTAISYVVGCCRDGDDNNFVVFLIDAAGGNWVPYRYVLDHTATPVSTGQFGPSLAQASYDEPVAFHGISTKNRLDAYSEVAYLSYPEVEGGQHPAYLTTCIGPAGPSVATWTYRGMLATKPVATTSFTATGSGEGREEVTFGLYEESWGYDDGTNQENGLAGAGSIFWHQTFEFVDKLDLGNQGTALFQKSAIGRALMTMASTLYSSNPRWYGLPAGLTASTRGWITVFPVLIQGTTGLSPDFVSSSANIFDLSFSEAEQSVSAADEVLLGGLGWIYNGVEAFEHGFMRYPEPIHAYNGADGTVFTAGDTYNYKAIYEWRDSRGRRHRSIPTPLPSAVTVTDGGSGGRAALSIVVPTLSHTNRLGVKAVLYRTVSGGTAYYRAAEVNADRLDAAWATASDTTTDAALQEQELLYTTGGILGESQPPPHRASAVWNERHFCVDRENEETDIYYSRRRVPGEPFIHSEFNRLRLPTENGDIIALSHLLDKGIAFRKTEIWAWEGEGYADTGAGANFNDPWLVSPSVGCVNPLSLVRIPQGLIFEAADSRLWMLDQGMQVKPIGDRVYDYLKTSGVVQGASLNEKHHALWLTSGGPSPVYDWLQDKWSTFSDFYRGQACVATADKLRFLGGKGLGSGFIVQGTSDYADPGSAFISLLLESGWMHLGGIGGYARLRGLLLSGHLVDEATLRVRLAYDNVPSWVDNITLSPSLLEAWDVSAHYGTGLTPESTYNGKAFLLKIPPSRQKCTSLRFQISDEDSGAGNTAGYSLSSVALLVAVKGKLQRVSTNRVLGA